MLELMWRVPSHGFRWVEAHSTAHLETDAAPDRYLTPQFPVHWREYDLRHNTPALFYEFSEVAPTDDGVQAFANEYGALGIGGEIMLLDGTRTRGERLQEWKAEIILIRHALRVWEALKRGTEQELRRWFRFDMHGDTPRLKYMPDEPWPPDMPMDVSDLFTRVSPGDPAQLIPLASPWPYSDPPGTGIPATPAGLALAFIRTLMSTRLPLQSVVCLGYLRDMSRPVPLSLKVVPSNLLTALWLQLGAAMEGDGRYQRCPQCQHWFQVPAKAKRANTTYCSPRCRIRAYRERHEQTQGTREPATTLDRASDPRLGKTELHDVGPDQRSQTIQASLLDAGRGQPIEIRQGSLPDGEESEETQIIHRSARTERITPHCTGSQRKEQGVTGSIVTRELKTGRRYYTVWRANGRQKWKAFTRRKDAERYLTTVVKEVHDGTYQDVHHLPMSAVFDRWLASSLELRVKQGLLKPSTAKSYRSMLDTHLRPVFGAYRSDRLTHAAVSQWAHAMADAIVEGNVAPKYYNNLLDLLHSIVAWARHPAQGYLAHDPLVGEKRLPKPRVERDFFRTP